MNEKQKIVLFLAFMFAVAAAVMAKKQILEIASHARSLAKTTTVVKEVDVNTTTMVVAKRDLPYGTALKPEDLKEIPWPADSLPLGTFRTIDSVFLLDLKRSVLRSTQNNEPLREAYITGPAQRASLSSLLGDGKTAITISVNDVRGVAGFVLPGDAVDVLFTREQFENKREGQRSTKATTNVLLRNTRILAIDQTIDDRLGQPKRVKTVTVEVTPRDAQRVALARKVGQMSLILRKYGEVGADRPSRPVTVADLSDRAKKLTTNTMISPVSTKVVDQQPKSVDVADTLAAIRVIRDGQKPVEYSVPDIETR